MHLPPVRQIQYLVALREELHFGKAARSLNVTQSTLSSGIRELEISLGITLVKELTVQCHLLPQEKKLPIVHAMCLCRSRTWLLKRKVSLTHWPCRSNWALSQLSPHLVMGNFAYALQKANPGFALIVKRKYNSEPDRGAARQ